MGAARAGYIHNVGSLMLHTVRTGTPCLRQHRHQIPSVVYEAATVPPPPPPTPSSTLQSLCCDDRSDESTEPGTALYDLVGSSRTIYFPNLPTKKRGSSGLQHVCRMQTCKAVHIRRKLVHACLEVISATQLFSPPRQTTVACFKLVSWSGTEGASEQQANCACNPGWLLVRIFNV
jgi:hypothetical protein